MTSARNHTRIYCFSIYRIMKRIVLFLAALICLCGCSKNQEPEQGEFDAMLLLGTWEELWPMEYSIRYTFYEGGIYTSKFEYLDEVWGGENGVDSGTYTFYDGILSFNGKQVFEVIKLTETELTLKRLDISLIKQEYIYMNRIPS